MAEISPLDKTTSRRRVLGNGRTVKIPSPPFRIRMVRFIKSVHIRTALSRTLFQSKKRMLISSTVVLLIISGGVFGYFEYQWQTSPQAIYTRKITSMTNQVNKYVSLPQDERPVVATVTNTAVLPHEAFFAHAKDGDKILMYKSHKLAVLYRPSTGQVITKATLNYQNVAPTPTQAPAVAGAATTSATISSQSTRPIQTPTSVPYHPQGKILIQPQQ